jgi:hypothetical protein
MITINGKTYSGNNLTISNNKIIIDGVEINGMEEAKEINVVITGNINSINLGAAKSFIVNGTVGDISTGSGDVTCENVTGSVNTASGDVDCKNIGGNVKTSSGDVNAETINGSVNTVSGNIKQRK